MAYYILRRIAYVVFVFFIISIIMFGIFQMVPGDRVAMMIDSSMSASNPERYKILYEQKYKQMGLDQPVVVQYWRWFSGMITGDFGFSAYYQQPVINIIEAPMMNTIQINIINLVLVFVITLPLGIYTAVKKGSAFDTGVQVFTVVGISLPSFLVALLCICFFAVLLNWFPISGSATAGIAASGASGWVIFWDKIYHMCLPLIVMTITGMAGITRYVRSAMVEALRQDYIRTARAKGLREKVVIYSHAFRNALIPVVTIMTGWFIGIFSGWVAIESIFSWNGIGYLLYSSLQRQDFSVVMTMNMFYALLALLGNLLMDLSYGLVDPRVKLS